MADVWYQKGIEQAFAGNLDWDADTIRVMLVNTSYTINKDDDFVNSGPETNEINATNYSRKTLANASVTLDDTGDRVAIDADDVTWSSLGNGTNSTIHAAIIYQQVGGDDTTPGDDPLIAALDVSDTTTNGSDITLSFNSSGIAEINT